MDAMAARYRVLPSQLRDMSAEDFAFNRAAYDAGFERRQLAVQSLGGKAMAVVEVGQ